MDLEAPLVTSLHLASTYQNSSPACAVGGVGVGKDLWGAPEMWQAGRAMWSNDTMKNEAQEAESSFNMRPQYQGLSFTIRTCHCPSAPRPCTGLAERAGTEAGFASLISGFLSSTIFLSHYHGWNVITIITTLQVYAQKLYRILPPETSVKLTYWCVYFGAALKGHPVLWHIIVFASDGSEGNRAERSQFPCIRLYSDVSRPQNTGRAVVDS